MKRPLRFSRVLAGDIWILCGQSSMYGIGLTKEELCELSYTASRRVQPGTWERP